MGQRFLQLKNTYTVDKDWSIPLPVARVPPNPNLFQPGSAFLYANINGIPSIGKYLIVGNGAIGAQPTLTSLLVLASTLLLAMAVTPLRTLTTATRTVARDQNRTCHYLWQCRRRYRYPHHRRYNWYLCCQEETRRQSQRSFVRVCGGSYNRHRSLALEGSIHMYLRPHTSATHQL